MTLLDNYKEKIKEGMNMKKAINELGRDVKNVLASGRPDKDICKELGLSEGSVKTLRLKIEECR